MKPSFVLRIRILSGFIVFCAFVFVVRLYFIQIVSGDEFSDKADRQYTQSVSTSFERGTIYFRNKDDSRTTAATLKSGFTIAINPTKITDPEGTYQKLSELLELDHDVFVAKATKPKDPYEEIAKRVEPELADRITALKLPGVSAYKDKWRYYPQNEVAARTLGFVAYKGDELGGRYGLERYYDDVLRRNHDDVYVNFFAEIFSNIKNTVSHEKNKEGDIESTIEPTVQAMLEKELVGVQQAYSSKLTGGVVINPNNGEIYALGLVPTFNLNSFQTEEDVSVFSNPIVESVYEMGSIIKPITMAAGLDAGVVTAQTTYNDTGSLTMNGKTFYNFDKRARGTVDMQAVLNNSLNTGVAFVVSKLGNERFTDYMYKFGLKDKTGIDLPNEAQNITENLNSTRDLEHAQASFGQGIALTPISTVRALSVLANGGFLITPHLVRAIDYKAGLPEKINPEKGQQVLKPETSKEISRMLVNVVDHALLEGKVKQEHYTIAAKTGTAQIPSPDGSYYADRYLHSFFGYFPADKPQFLIFLYTYDPRGVEYASHTLTNPFIDLTKFLINYYQVPPDR